ncbi:C40 family peptidase [Hymenobacter baengnokdamensis]|uniref:C40 family peptidase n=1 Tax=Hymenobacter baengnokdamensis TaxID=2615203 RepID=UPI00177E8A40|nr:C40 family peptidase [Hymenobacter baengnokdamensis]
MQSEKTKVRPIAKARIAACRPAAYPTWQRYYGLALVLLLLASSCQRKLNQLNGRYYSARDMARMKHGQRIAGPSAAKTKTKTTTAGSSGVATTTKVVVKRPFRTGNATGVLASVIDNARAYQGTPYLFGGTTRMGMDCSALLQLSFAEAGITIPRSSNEQAAWGDPVKPTELRPGDFLFFGASPGSQVITHVGMVTVVDEEGVEFIHASTSLGVIENSFEADYYLSRFIRAVRPKL